jgi:ribosome-associated protein
MTRTNVDASDRQRGLRVRPGFVVPESELVLRFTRSGGPGGQNVNKVATRVELEFDVAASSVLAAEEKTRVLERLGRRASRDGVVRVVAQRFRSQSRNEEDARERLAELLAAALAVPKKRRPTRRPVGSREARLETKRRRSQAKSRRRAPRDDDSRW